MPIDSNDWQVRTANPPIDRRIESDANSTVLSLWFARQQYPPSVSIEDGITIDSGDPIAQTTDRTSKATNSSFTTLNETDPSSIPIYRIPLPPKARVVIPVAEAGIENRFRELNAKKRHGLPSSRPWMTIRTSGSEENRNHKNNAAEEDKPIAESRLTATTDSSKRHPPESRRDENRLQMPLFRDNGIGPNISP
jgi:hypothetical protein